MKAFATLPLCALFLACGGSAPPAAGPSAPEPAVAADGAPTAAAPASTSPTAASAFAQQASAGQALYGQHCGSCHGPSGNDGKAPALVGLGQGALPLMPPAQAKLRREQFKTVGDVASFVVKAMPPKAPGSLSADDYYAILAFDLKANGIDLGDKKLDATLAATLEIPRK